MLEEIANLPTFEQVSVSPDGSEAVLFYDLDDCHDLYRLDLDTGDVERWPGHGCSWSPAPGVAWDVEGARVFAYLGDGNDGEGVYAVDRDGSAEYLTDLDGRVEIGDVDPAGDGLLLESDYAGSFDVYHCDLDTGETTAITDHDAHATGGVVSPDGTRVAYGSNETDDSENRDVYVTAVDGSGRRNLRIGHTGSMSGPIDWHPSGNALLVADQMGKCGIYDFETEEVSWYHDGEYDVLTRGFLPDGERFMGTYLRDVRTIPVVFDVETGERRELDVPGSVTREGIRGVDGRRVLLTHTSPTRRPELLVYDLETDEYDRVLNAGYGPFSRDEFATADQISFESNGIPDTPARAVDHDPYDEFEIDGLLYDSGERPSPLIVNPHGGPYNRDAMEFDLYTQFLVSQGYSVLQVNYRGSHGRGWSFREELYGDWGGAEQGDIATGVEHVRDEYDWIDGDRIAVFGGSYGGYSAYWQLVQYPDLYDAGIAWIGQTDLAAYYEDVTHLQYWMETYLGTPDENPDLYATRSPINYVENLDTPLLIVHGSQDPIVPIDQARRFTDALEDAGFEAGETGDFEFVEFEDEGHGSRDSAKKTRLFRTLAEFLDRRLGD